MPVVAASSRPKCAACATRRGTLLSCFPCFLPPIGEKAGKQLGGAGEKAKLDRTQNGKQPCHQLVAIADRLERLRPDWTRPDRYFDERSELLNDLRTVARSIAGE
jgi:hypothetical protein